MALPIMCFKYTRASDSNLKMSAVTRDGMDEDGFDIRSLVHGNLQVAHLVPVASVKDHLHKQAARHAVECWHAFMLS